MKERILVFSEKLYPYGGGAQFALNLLLKSLKEEFEICIVTLCDLKPIYKKEYYEDIKIFNLAEVKSIPGSQLSLFLTTFYYRGFIEKLISKCDVVYIADTWIAPAMIAKKIGKPVVKSFHSLANVNYFTAPWEEVEYTNLLGLIKSVVKVCGLYGKSTLLKIIEPPYAILLDKLSKTIVRSFIDIAVSPSIAMKNVLDHMLAGRVLCIPNLLPEEPYIKLHNVEERARTFIYIGGKSYQKGFYHLMQTLVSYARNLQVLANRKRIVFELVDILSTTDVSVKQYKFGNTVIRLRTRLNRTNLMKLFEKVHVAIVPSICFESFCYAVIEAQLWGRAVIASRIGGIPEIVEDNVTGFLVTPGSHSELLEKINLFCDLDESEVINMGLKARKFLLKKMDNQRLIRKWIRLFESVS